MNFYSLIHNLLIREWVANKSSPEKGQKEKRWKIIEIKTILCNCWHMENILTYWCNQYFNLHWEANDTNSATVNIKTSQLVNWGVLATAHRAYLSPLVLLEIVSDVPSPFYCGLLRPSDFVTWQVWQNWAIDSFECLPTWYPMVCCDLGNTGRSVYGRL